MEIRFANEKQCAIADLLWAAQSHDEAMAVIRVFGKEAEVVYHMLVAAEFDGVEDVTQAAQILENLK
jgi:hypothetical protein